MKQNERMEKFCEEFNSFGMFKQNNMALHEKAYLFLNEVSKRTDLLKDDNNVEKHPALKHIKLNIKRRQQSV